MDCNMPIMSGYEAVKILKEKIRHGEIADIYIVACTAGITQSNIEKCERYGFDDFLEKPISRDYLKTFLKKIFNGWAFRILIKSYFMNI